MSKGKIQKRWKQITAAVLVIAFTATSIPYEGDTAKAQEPQTEQTADADIQTEADGGKETEYTEGTKQASGEQQPED